MRAHGLRVLVSTLALFVSVSSPALGQSSRLAEAQRAYAAVDYEATRREAKAALEQGGNDAAATGELYLLLGMAAAALDQVDEARSAFSHALAVNPDLKLERDLSPKMRAPYQEARGGASAADGKPPLGVDLFRRKQELELSLRDRLQVAASVELWSRTRDADSFSPRRVDPARTRRIPIPTGAELQYYLRVLDRHGNALLESGSRDEPRRLPLAPTLSTGGTSPLPPPPREVSRAPYLVTAGSLAVLGLAAGGVATAMYLRREDAARDWNAPGCEQPGATRGEQCGSVDERRRSAEQLAVGFAAGGGALLLGGLVTWLLAPAAPANAGVALDLEPNGAAVRVRSRF